jgi:aerobic-type carbon monoxide dehydrogenase small subunit (CoxS/CutS family)
MPRRNPDMDIHVELNGKPVVWQVNPGEILLEVLRREGLLSVKWGCGNGDCGACTVLVDGKSMRSCLMLAGQVENRSVDTVESMGTLGEPHPLQQAFVENGAVQCGYCTPGMLLSAKELLDREPEPSAEQVKEALDGNLCRCTGYKKIIEAVQDAAGRMRK